MVLSDPTTTPATSEFSTPMMQQYLELKKQYPECLLLFRLGDFYELFLEDAQVGAAVLGITLTSRSRGKDGRIPMAGVPYHAITQYLTKLVKAGYKVAICDQVSEADGRTLVERQVTRVVTAGTFFDDSPAGQRQARYVVSVGVQSATSTSPNLNSQPAGPYQLGLSACDITTGELYHSQLELQQGSELAATLTQVVTVLSPQEWLMSPTATAALQNILNQVSTATVSVWADWITSPKTIQKTLKTHPITKVPLAKTSQVGQESLANLLAYLAYTQKSVLTHLKPLQPLLTPQHLKLDPATIRNLELFEPLLDDDRTQGPRTLLELLDGTKTNGGSRLLKQWLHRPLRSLAAIATRLDTIEWFQTHQAQRAQVCSLLTQVADLERIIAQISLRMINPRNVYHLGQTIHTSQEICQVLAAQTQEFAAQSQELASLSPPQSAAPTPNLIPISIPTPLTALISATTPALLELAEFIVAMLVPTVGHNPKTGQTIQAGVDPELDRLCATVSQSKDWISEFEATARSQTGITSLKVRFNQVFGFYIEVSNANLTQVPSHFQRKQTLVNAERFITPELKHHEDIILEAEQLLLQREQTLLNQIIEQVLSHQPALQNLAKTLAEIDILATWAELAQQYHYARPQLNDSGTLELNQSRHPVVERHLPPGTFVPNDLSILPTGPRLLLLTGPNMAGKSVLMRQVALTALMAQCGCFVPAHQANISLYDQIFVRSGAGDSITSGLSTFMVEMTETATILKQATAHSLIIMDEIGRGTSTYDGISLAWAIAEHLVSAPFGELKPLTLFATHYHELQALAHHFPTHMSNYHLAITTHHDQPVFLYTLTEGGSSHSHGVHVAALAGIPASVIDRAKQILNEIEIDHAGQNKLFEHNGFRSKITPNSPETRPKKSRSNSGRNSPLVKAPPPQIIYDDSNPHDPATAIKKKLQTLNLNEMTPLAALNTLAKLKKLLPPGF